MVCACSGEEILVHSDVEIHILVLAVIPSSPVGGCLLTLHKKSSK